MKILDFFTTKKANKEEKASGRFASFFLNAPIKSKERVFTDAARRANEDQREVFKRATAKLEAE